jgi:acetylornithine deacetylase/succinyl-diaminopimelate desuccinylase-like protein
VEGEELRAKVRELMPRAKEDLAALVAFRSVADPAQFPAEECEGAARWLVEAFAAAGLDEVAAHPTADGSSAVIGHRPAPAGAPTVLLYCHYDVQPPLGENQWESPVFELTERDGRWYGRGSADCKGNAVAHLTALRALEGELSVGLKVVAEGSEEQGTGGLEALLRDRPDLLAADAIVVADTGNFELGLPTLTATLRGVVGVVVTLSTLSGPLHSGVFGGPAPDAVTALVQLLSGLHDEDGNTTIEGLASDQGWSGVEYSPERFRADAEVLDGVGLAGDGDDIAAMLWARPALTVLGIDAPPVSGSAMAIPATARARLSLRLPPGISGADGLRALTAQLEAAVPFGARLEIETEEAFDPFVGSTSGPAFEAMKAALEEAYGRAATTQGQGGSIPLCNALQETYPEAEIMLIGVEEPLCRIHAPNESVDPAEIENIAFAEALFLQRLGRA